MEIVVLDDVAAIGRLGADAICGLLRRRPTAVLGLATGSSPLAIYDELAARCAAGSVSFAQAKGLNPIVPVVVMDERESDNVVAAEAVTAGANIASGAELFTATK